MESGKIFEQPTFNNLPDSGFSLADADDKAALAQARRDYANLSLSDASPIRRPKHSGVGNLNSLLDEEGAQHLAHVVQAIWKQESGSGKNARTSTDGARGGMQIMPATFKMYARAGEQIDDPDDNMRVGIRLIKDLGDKFGNDPARIAAGYFSGAGNVNAGKGDAWKRDRADGNGKRVSAYVADVMEKAADFYESGRKERPAAEQTPAPEAKQPEQKAVLPDLDKAPAWKDVLARPDFWELTPEERQTAKEAYFDYWIAPHAGGEAASLRIKFMAQPMDEPKRTWGEAATDTLAQLGEGVNTILGAVPNLVAPDSGVAQFFNDNADTWRGNQSLALKTKMAKADRAISEAGKDGMISQLAEAAGQYFTDPALAARFITTNLPSMIPGVGAAKLAQAAALARGASLAKAAGVATTAAGVTNAVLNAGGARGDAFEDIKQTLINQGMSAKEAEETALRDSRVSAAIGALTGYLSGKTGLEKNLVSQAGTRGALKSMAAGTAAELAGEINEEATPQLATNALASQYDQRDITHNIGRTIVETALGAGPGSVLSGVKAAQHSQSAEDSGVPTPDANETSEAAQPVQPAQSPQTGAHPTSQVADNIVREAAAEAGVSTQDLLPEEPQQAAQTSPEQSAQPVQTLAPEEEARAAELYIKASDGTLNAEEAAELAGLEQRLAQEQSVEESAPNFTQEQPEAASAQESAPPQNVPATAQESAPESVQNVAEPTQQTQPMQQAQEAPAEAPAAQASPNQPTFASAADAQGFIDQLGIGATHAVAQDGKRFIIRKKDAPNAGQSAPIRTPVAENDASARVPNGTQTQNAPESESVDSPAPTNIADSTWQAEIARLQSAPTVRNIDGKPFRSEEAAAQYRQANALDGTHKVQKVQTGYVLQKLPEGKMPEKRTHAHTGQAKGEAREMRARQSDEQQNNASGQQAASPVMSRSAKTRAAYEARIDELFKGAKANPEGVKVLDRSDMLDMLGMGDKPLKLAEGKVIAGQSNHPKITAEVWKKIPEWVENPAMVFDSDTVAGRLVFIAPEKVRGNDVRVVIEPKQNGLEAHVLVNAYDTGTGTTPYSRWARDRLLRYADIKNASRIDERFGLQLPDILRNPAFMPDAQIHGMGRGNTKALRRTKILTENNLKGYRKNNPESAQAESVADARKAETIREHVKAITDGWKRAPEVIVARNMQDEAIPEAVRRHDTQMKKQGASGEAEGFIYQGKVYLVADQLGTLEDATRTLFHEALGHYGLKGVFGNSLDGILGQIVRTRLREVVAKAREYGLMPDNMPKDAPLAEQLKALGEKGRMTAAEEILAEMAQDHPELGFVKRSVAAIRQWLRGHVPGLSNIKLTDDEIIHSYILPARGWVKNGKRSAQTQIEPMYSRRQSDDEKARILQGEPVAKVSIEDVPAGGYADIARWASSIFARQGGKAVSPIIGEVVLNEQSARDSMAHGGANAAKKAAFGAVKDVIERGALVYQAKDGRVDSFYISAPVSISGKDNIVTVLTHRDPNTQRMYLHSVLLKENLLKPSVSAVDAKTSERSSATTSEGTYSVATGRADGKASGAQVAERLQALLSRDITPMYSRKQAVEAKKALEKMEPVVIGVDKAIESDDIAAARSRAKQLYKALKPVKTIDGRQVEFPISGFKETAQHAADRRVLLVIQKLGELIERAQPLWRDALNDPKRPNVVAFHNYGVKASFPSGEAFVRIVLREDNDGHVYYDNDATSVEAIDKTKAPVSQPDRKPNPGEGAEGLSKNRLAQWWDSVNTEEPQHSRSKATQQAYEKRINELFAGGKANLEGVRVLDRSDVLGLLGYEDKPIVLAEGKVKSGIINHPRITAQVWKKVPGWLENPAAVFKSETAEGLVFIAPELIAGRPVSVIVRPDAGHPNTLQAHVLLNAYERSANTPFMRWINNGLMQYADKKKFPAVFESASGRRLPSTALQNKPGMPKILTENNLVGYRKQQEAPRYARKKTERSVWDAPPTFMERMIYDYQDKHIHLKKIIQSLGEVYESFNTYLQEELYHGRVAARVHKFAQRELNVLLKDMALKGITQDALEGFLWARHAKERNAQIAKINPQMPDGGSGLTSAEIADYFAGRDVKRGGEIYLAGMKLADRQRLEKLAARVDAMNAGTRQLLLQYGLETPETIKKWDETYKYYVPLHREDMDGVPAIGQGFSTKGSASKRAMGSTQRAENILAHIALQREAAITRGEKNRVALSLYGLALRNPQPDFWQIDKIPQKRIIGQDGTVKTINDPGYKNMPNVLMVRIGGQDRAIVFDEHNDRALQVAAALKNLDAEQLDNVTAFIARVTRYISSINTQYNPVFGIVNLWRDTQAVVLNLSSTPIKGKRAEVLKNILPAMRAIWRAERPRLDADGKPILETDAWSKLYEEMQLAGGTTGYRDMFRTATERTDQLKRELAKNDRSRPRKTFDAVLNVLDAYNTAMENATRLSAYKAARDSKLSVDRSASVAKNITVNFNRKGRLTSKTGALYGFFNASVQGTARTYETLSSSAGRTIILGGVMTGVLQTLMAAGMDDDDWEAIPEFVKQRSLIIPTGNGEYVTWQYPLGFNALPNIGRITAETIFGKRSIGSALVDLLEATLDATNPLGSGTPLQIVSFTITDPIAALAENKNFAGYPIAKQDRNSLAPTPGHKRARDTSSHLSRGIAQGINWATGGTDYTPGLLSPTPDQIDYIFGSITGGLGRETNKLYQAGEALLTGQSVPARKIPLISRFYGTTRDDMSITSQYWDNVQKLALLKNEIDGRKKDGIDNSRLLKERPEAVLLTDFNKSAQRISKLRTERHRIEFDEKMNEAERTERLRKLDAEIINKMRDYNKRVSDAKTGKRS